MLVPAIAGVLAGFIGLWLAGAGEPVAAVAPVTADGQQAKDPAQVARFADGPASTG
jgi:hypothetical protein